MPGIPSIPGTGEEKRTLVSPEAAVRIYGAADIVLQGLDVEFDVRKDLDEEPNEATISIWNLTESTRSFIVDPETRDTPIELLITPFGSKDLVVAFSGEVDHVENIYQRPGYLTRLRCSSQKWFHKSVYIDGKTYKMGTPAQTIVDDLVTAIGLPKNQIAAPLVNPIALAHSFTGAAFQVLKGFLFDYGRLCYVLDGVLTITSSYTPPDLTITKISDDICTTVAEPIEFMDAADVEIRTVTEVVGLDPLQKLSKKDKKKLTKRTRGVAGRFSETSGSSGGFDPTQQLGDDQDRVVLTSEDLVEVEAIDASINGIQRELLCLPTLQPDQLIQFDDGNQYKVRSVEHYGEISQRGGHSEVSTFVEADNWLLSDEIGGQTFGVGF